MTNPIEPVTAWAAVDPKGQVLLGTVRATETDARIVIIDRLRPDRVNPLVFWDCCCQEGWTIRQVEIRVKEEG